MPAPFQKDLEQRGKGGVFYLHGEDEFRKEESARLLVETHLDPATEAFNLDRLRGSEVDVERLASMIATPPMMAEWRVIVLRETEALASSSRARDLLVGTATEPPPGLALVLLCTVPSGSKARFYRDLASKARSAEFPGLSANDVPGWLVEWAKETHGVEMTGEAARALGAAIGTDLGVLAQEVRKLADFVEVGGVVDLDAVEAAGTRVPKQDRWQWFDMVGERDLDGALVGLSTLLAQRGESGVGLVIGLATHLLRLGAAREGGDAALQRVLPPYQRWLSRKLVSQSRRWSRGELEAALAGLLRVDALLKSAGLSDESLLEEWLLTEIARSTGVLDVGGGVAA